MYFYETKVYWTFTWITSWLSCLLGGKRLVAVAGVAGVAVAHGIDDCLSNNPLVRGGGGEQGELKTIQKSFYFCRAFRKARPIYNYSIFLVMSQNCLAFLNCRNKE